MIKSFFQDISGAVFGSVAGYTIMSQSVQTGGGDVTISVGVLLGLVVAVVGTLASAVAFLGKTVLSTMERAVERQAALTEKNVVDLRAQIAALTAERDEADQAAATAQANLIEYLKGSK